MKTYHPESRKDFGWTIIKYRPFDRLLYSKDMHYVRNGFTSCGSVFYTENKPVDPGHCYVCSETKNEM